MTEPAAADGVPAAPRLGLVLVVALVARLAIFPFAENKHGDAPMRALIAERLVLDPAAAHDPRAYCQFGPLHATLMRAFIAVDGVVPRSSRALSLVAGLLVFVPFMRLATRIAGARRAELAALGLAVSPLHVQASTTAASEALYLLLFVAMLERLTAALADPEARVGRFVVAGALASLAAVTRYDAWFSIPAAAVAAWWVRPPLVSRAQLATGLCAFLAAAAVLPAAWISWCAVATHDPFFFAHYIEADHAQLAAAAVARWGPVVARLRQLGIWALSFVAAMTPPLALGALIAWRRRARLELDRPALRVALAVGLAPVALYLAQGLLRLRFEPLPRFAIVPGALLLPLAAAAVPHARLAAARAAVPLAAVAFAAVAYLVAMAGAGAGGRVWGGAESMGALTRLDAEDRAVATYLRAHRQPHERVMLEPLAFAEIAIAEEARVPETESMSLTVTRTPRATVAETRLATGARWFAAYDHPGGWIERLPDWPRDALAFGHWRLFKR
ncbi:MAG TPA: glycosyltransferase family 39 protein [Polyangia bacterium]|nr:glycosyltransferase family 39 protein [Polyangia bacterium]